ncbi:MAG TPA: glycosyltransferase family 4 protein [Thermoanaerobaculia bacterium]|jgi:UDP-N-acetylmuramyl pentapeptide phosphotransferase/UDP-N-acetylglucosamine-1-phosphate transferase
MITAFLLAIVFFASLAATGMLVRHVGIFAILDQPNERSLHVRPTPRTGGVGILTGIVLGVALTLAYALFEEVFAQVRPELLWIVGMLLLIATVSLVDDRHHLPPLLRLFFHLLAASGVVLGGGVAVEQVTIPFLGSYSLGVLAAPLSIVVITWTTNLYNFMDGMDGLAASMSVFGFTLISGLALQAHDVPLALLAAIVVPAVIGFLFHNRPPASIFMGDSGSTSLGFLAGALGIAGIDRGDFHLGTWLLAFSPFLVDATVTLLRRAMQRKRIWQAHREHYYQRLVLSGWSHRRTLGWEAAVMMLFAWTAFFFERGSDLPRLAILIGAIALYLVLIAAVRRVETRK